MLTNSLHHRKT